MAKQNAKAMQSAFDKKYVFDEAAKQQIQSIIDKSWEIEVERFAALLEQDTDLPAIGDTPEQVMEKQKAIRSNYASKKAALDWLVFVASLREGTTEAPAQEADIMAEARKFMAEKGKTKLNGNSR